MEHEFHNWLKQQTSGIANAEQVLVGIGDDAAVLRPTAHSIVMTTDTIADGTHFDSTQHSLEQIGRKSLAVNLSDLAAMAAQPVAAALTFVLPNDFGFEDAKRLYAGIAELAQQFNVAIVGGDTNRWDGKLVVGATILGRRSVSCTGWSIGGAQIGDSVVVSGSFGGSIRGRHLSFTPRVNLALHLAKNYHINAATDASDSLSIDLNAITNNSRCGVDLDLDSIPISGDVDTSDPETALAHALGDGEDFELILTMPPSEAEKMLRDKTIQETLTIIGSVTGDHQQLRGYSKNHPNKTIQPCGYVH